MPNYIKNISILTLCLLIFLGLFYQFPRNNSLPGNWDTWFNLALFENYHIYLKDILHLSAPKSSYLFPTKYPFLHAEPMFVNGFIYQLIRLFSQNPITIWYVLISLVFTLNTFALYLIFRKTGKNVPLSLAGGLLFTFSNFALSSLDQLNVVSVYPVLFSFYFLLHFKENYHKLKHFFLSLLFLAIQLYCSGYYFILGGMLWVCLYLYKIRWFSLRKILYTGIPVFILIIPYIKLYLLSGLSSSTYNPMNSTSVISAFSFKMQDFFHSHPYNLLYGSNKPEHLIEMIKSLFPGLVMILTSAFGLALNKKNRKFLFGLIFFSLLIASGPMIQVGEYAFYSPLQAVLDKTGLSYFFRTPIRAFTIVLFILIFSTIFYFEQLVKFHKHGIKIVIGCLIIFTLENIPLKFQYYDSKKYIEMGNRLNEQLNNSKHENLILFLPSTILSNYPLHPFLDESNREYIYMYWQSKIQKPILNGMVGYIPESRMELNQAIKSNTCNILKSYLNRFEENYIIIYVPTMHHAYEPADYRLKECADWSF